MFLKLPKLFSFHILRLAAERGTNAEAEDKAEKERKKESAGVRSRQRKAQFICKHLAPEPLPPRVTLGREVGRRKRAFAAWSRLEPVGETCGPASAAYRF